MLTLVKLLAKPKLNEPVLICGLPGSGYVGKVAVDHLISELKAQPLATIYSHSFPPQVLVKSDGSVELMKHEVKYWQSQDNVKDLLLYTGDSQPVTPEAEYELSNRVLDLAEEFGVKRVFTLAAYITGQFTQSPKVFGTATETTFLKELAKEGVNTMSEGSITGMNGIVIGLAAIRGMVGTCLLGETSGYIIDPRASYVVLEVLMKILGINVDLAGLEARAKQSEAIGRMIEEGRTSPQEKRTPERELGYIS